MTWAGVHSEGFTPELKTFCSDVSPFTHITGAPPTDLISSFLLQASASICMQSCVYSHASSSLLLLLCSVEVQLSEMLPLMGCPGCFWLCLCKIKNLQVLLSLPQSLQFSPKQFFLLFFCRIKNLKKEYTGKHGKVEALRGNKWDYI